jgi:hypothetical protein
MNAISNSDAILASLSKAIKTAHQRAELAQHDALTFAVEAGNALLEAKKVCGHGAWLPWLSGNCSMSERTAQSYMRLAKKMAAMPVEEAQRVADLSLREAVQAVAGPKRGPVVEDLTDSAKAEFYGLLAVWHSALPAERQMFRDRLYAEAERQGVEPHLVVFPVGRSRQYRGGPQQ